MHIWVAGLGNGWNVLHRAVAEGQADIVARVLAEATDKHRLLQATDKHGSTPLHLVARDGFLDIAELLLSKSPRSASQMFL